MSLSTKSERFMEFLDHEKIHKKYDERLSELPYQDRQTLVVDFTDLYDFDVDFADDLLGDPKNLQGFSADVLSRLKYRYPEYAGSSFRIAIRGLPDDTPLREVGSANLGQYIQVSGIIVKASQVKPYIISASWRCRRCGEVVLQGQSGDSLMRPSACGACERGRSFELVPEMSGFVDSQIITLQERPEELPPGQLPRALVVILKDDLVDVARPGDRVVVSGTLRLKDPNKTRVFDVFLEAFHVEGSERQDVEILAEDESEIISLSQDPFVFSKLLKSTAPSIHGHEKIKEAIIYLLFGGAEKVMPDVRIRGDINALLVGDPGVAKSQLLEYAAMQSPRGILTTGRGSSAAGLTASVTKEKGGTMVLEAGALVLGDRGLVCIDEIDKMKDEDRGAIHPAMEQQRVHIAKGGIVATLNARTSILAAANPAMGRYNPYQNVAENIKLPVTILSRFDLIFVIKDLPQPAEDDILAEHILKLHQQNGSIAEPEVSVLLFRKYIAYAKRIYPKIPDDVAKRLRAFYVEMRNANKDTSAVSITARQLESVIRISEARARLHLRKEVLLEDAEAAIVLMKHSLSMVGLDFAGEPDIDVFYSGKSSGTQHLMGRVLAVIVELETKGGYAEREEIMETLYSEGISRDKCSTALEILHRDGTIFKPSIDRYRRTI